MDKPDSTPRIDKWLWSVRAFKTRSQATDACRAGKVKVDETPIKPSREVKTGMIITLQQGPLKRTLKVTGLLQKRVGAKLVGQFMEDLTPEEEYQKLEAIRTMPAARARGAGRPTKKERRDIGEWLDWD